MLETLLNIPFLTYGAFITAGLLLNFTPGADFLLTTFSGLRGGPRIGRAAAYGINLGILVHVVLAAAGVSALLIAYPAAYSALKYAGAIYLLYMAWNTWCDDGTLGEGEAALSAKAALKRGFFTNLLNPKTGLFIFAFIPQFTDPAYGVLWHQILIFGLIFLTHGFFFALALGTLAGHLGPFLRGHIRILNTLTALLFGGLAAKLLID